MLWLARCIYSETKQPDEQKLVAWVIRNRVETRYRGQDTYDGVVLDPYQFSAFNPGSEKRRLYTNLQANSTARGWTRALRVAHEVYYAPGYERPFPAADAPLLQRALDGRRRGPGLGTRQDADPAHRDAPRVDPRRFRFYASIAAMTIG